jgi:hypothetical protein
MTRMTALALLTVAAMQVAVAQVGGDIHNVNSSIQVAPGEHSGDLSTVNGSIRIGENAAIASARTVNGGLQLEPHVTAGELTTVNGGIELKEGVHVTGNVHTANGGLRVKDGVEITGDLTNVNGAIIVGAAHIGGSVNTAAASIDLGPNAHVDGNVHMSKETGVHFGFQTIPRVVIEPGTVVKGTLHFERPVALYVSDHATIGTVEGAEVHKFSGDHAPE